MVSKTILASTILKKIMDTTIKKVVYEDCMEMDASQIKRVQETKKARSSRSKRKKTTLHKD